MFGIKPLHSGPTSLTAPGRPSLQRAAAIQEGMDDKIATFIHNVSAAIAAVVIGFWRAWDIFIVLLSAWPALILAGFLSASISAYVFVRARAIPRVRVCVCIRVCLCVHLRACCHDCVRRRVRS